MNDNQTQIDVAVIKDWRKSVDKRLKTIEEKVDSLPEALTELLDERYALKDETITVKSLKWVLGLAVAISSIATAIWAELHR